MRLSNLNHRLFYVCLLIILSQRLQAQDALTRKLAFIAVKHTNNSLLIGQKVPDSSFYKTYNYPTKMVSLNNLKGKLVILDFWTQYCSSCVAQFPKLKKLQGRFKDSIVIMPVTFQSRKSIESFFLKRKNQGNPIELPSIVEDTLLWHLFPHNGNPYEIWIDKDGFVRGITRAHTVSESMIEKALKNDYTVLKNISLDPSFDIDKPFLVNGNGGNENNFTFRSLLTKQNTRLSSNWHFHADSSYLRIFVSNFPIISIFKKALFEYSPLKNKYSELIYDPLNKRSIIEPQVAIDPKQLYCYDLVLPRGFTYKEGFEIMLQDLESLFKTDIHIENKNIDCLSITWDSSLCKVDSALKEEGPNNSGKELISINNFVSYLNRTAHIPYVVNDIGTTTKINIKEFTDKINDVDSLRRALKKYNMKLIKTKVQLPMLVFERKSNGIAK